MALAGPLQQMIEASGYILVGGRSSRFGSAKGLHRLDGRALALRVADALSERVCAVTLVGNRGLYETALGIPTI
ncbi:MAG: NTP transferase domain-containing protein, partial [Bryobacterales bacterium]|nr:NTP transferase domain-containing protein [Bryobacterales bacterium]